MLASQWRVATCRPDTCRVVWQCPLTSLLIQIWINILNGLTWQCLFLKHKMELKVCCNCCSVTHCIWTVLLMELNWTVINSFCCYAALPCLHALLPASLLLNMHRLCVQSHDCSIQGRAAVAVAACSIANAVDTDLQATQALQDGTAAMQCWCSSLCRISLAGWLWSMCSLMAGEWTDKHPSFFQTQSSDISQC